MLELINTLSHPFIQRAIIGIVLTALASSISGTFMVFRGLSFLPSGVAHAALGGAALGILIQSTDLIPWFDPLLGAMLFGIILALIVGYAGESSVVEKMEAAVGVSFALSMSVAVFFIYYIPPEKAPQVWGYLIGDILLLTEQDVILLFATVFSLILLTALFFREFVYVSFDMEGITVFGLNAKLYHYLMLILAALAVTVATKAVGAILVFAIMVAPAAASREFMKSVAGVMAMVFLIALSSEIIGLVASFYWNISPSAIAALLLT